MHLKKSMKIQEKPINTMILGGFSKAKGVKNGCRGTILKHGFALYLPALGRFESGEK